MSEVQQKSEAPEEYLLDLTKGQDKPEEAPTQIQGQPEPEEILPEKYKGKNLKDVVEMHRNLETELGRARNEIGQVRRLADELLGIRVAAATQTAPQTPERKKLTPDDILADPETAVVAVAKEVAEGRASDQEQRLARLEYELQIGRFEQKHPDYKAKIEDQEFLEWVKKSPLRVRLAQAAIQGDFTAADELFSLHKEVQAVGAQPASQQQAPSQTEQARRATLTRSSGGSAAAQSAISQGANKPIWSREKLLLMRLENPDEFERLQPQILEAYAEKRVR